MKLGGHLLHFSRKIHKSIALSSGETELSAQVGGLTHALGVKNLFVTFSLRSCCDSSAARSVPSRLVTGKLRHQQLKHLWVQEEVARGEVEIQWISRQHELRPDILKQYLSEEVC